MCMFTACGINRNEKTYRLSEEQIQERIVAEFQEPKGCKPNEETEKRTDSGFMFHQEILGENGYLHVGLSNGDKISAAENGLKSIKETLKAEVEEEITECKIEENETVYYSAYYEYENQNGTGTCYARLLAAYVTVDGTSSVMVMVNASAEEKEKLCGREQLYQFMEQTVQSLKIK